MKAQAVTVLIVAALVLGSAAGYLAGNATGRTTTKTIVSTHTQTVTRVVMTEPSQTSTSTAFTTYFHYPISVNYSGTWNLAYWGQNGTASPDHQVYCNACSGGTMPFNVYESSSGSGNYQTEVTTYGMGYVQNTLCVDAAIVGSSTGTLTLTVLGKTGSASGLNPTVEVCATFAV